MCVHGLKWMDVCLRTLRPVNCNFPGSPFLREVLLHGVFFQENFLLSSIYQLEELFENSLNSINSVIVAVNYYVLSYIEFSMIFLFLLYI